MRQRWFADSDFEAGRYSAQRGHPQPGKWASPQFRKGWQAWGKFSKPRVYYRTEDDIEDRSLLA